MPGIDFACRFAGIDPGSDDQVLTLCLESAQAWYREAGVPELDGDAQYAKQYDLWVCNLTAWLYDNRGATGDAAQIPPYILSSVHQLRARAKRIKAQQEADA